MINKESLKYLRKKRHLRLRKKIIGTKDKPRLNVFYSNKYFYAQIIDDQNKVTLCSVHSKEIKANVINIKVASDIGRIIAQKALKNGISRVVFDRGGRLYHGRIKALADSSRKEGLIF
ncbi:MAG: 50S ribosomal protein L18 [Candidatus Phytoplasma stylosanthis]|uniref:50S ribosomal protein L18 n=1 Tax=Candidatus Phytoplasma stylosanthis TaxID=2798314 RepID=UPI00293A018F|nr:50S ribosomal protein L18 [Candidatus Phytoplasma stylosanthis]MDV3167854.1 50S ribosomal protein L18 [Candidatus Phytoplasma stylosanthis]MDV3170870.1 50S ribosomal protein L18 [Candidatus Phytoplasma stylosanthis]MDV3173504.1 50S ribosomal protein L18 [Candidatus Phytoplasma stylosanthis]MDV3174050.1 50S ribosomal protein L18 [Candidatus Phytoplasma stylosanthis]MDV3196248.1 50S ribosomal protein L18 [Candidatus Phytoplasma stylosanthis]